MSPSVACLSPQSFWASVVALDQRRVTGDDVTEFCLHNQLLSLELLNLLLGLVLLLLHFDSQFHSAQFDADSLWLLFVALWL